MATRELSRRDARRIAVRGAQLAAAQRPVELVELVGALGMLRVELTSIVLPSADHIAWSRLGDSYRPRDIACALASGRLFERGWMLRPMSDLGLYLEGMDTWIDRIGGRDWYDANEPFARGMLERIELDGPLTSTQLPDAALVPWPSSGWSNNRNVTKMLEFLHMSGQLAVVGRAGRLRIWDLAERVYPPTEAVPREDALRIRSEQLLRACGIMRDSVAVSPGEVHNNLRVGERVSIEGVPGRWLADPDALAALDGDTELDEHGRLHEFGERTVILSPFDRLMTDPQRAAKLFEFDYTLEMYQPVATRRWGAFALPILRGDRLVGKVDARSDHDAGRFIVHRIHEDAPFDARARDAVHAEILRLANWMRLDVEFETQR